MNRFQQKSMRATLSALLASVALAGCAVGPNYTKPNTELVGFHNAAASTVAQTKASVPLETWWTGFSDPMLVIVVQRALDQNLDLAAAVARVQQARAMASGAGAQLLPTVDMGATATANHLSVNSPRGALDSTIPGFTRNIRELSAGPSASWELDIFGGNRRNAAVFRNQAEAVEADHAQTRIMVAADAADAYLQIRGYQARLSVAVRQIETDEHFLSLIHDRYRAGSATGKEIAQGEALLQQARASVPPLRLALERQLNRLDVLMGVQPGTYAEELQTAQDVPSIPAIPNDQKPTEVLRRRPDVIAAERRLAASNERIGVAISEYYPKVSLSGALGFDALDGNKFFSGGAFQAAGGGALRWRLFDFGKVDAEVAVARGANAEALAVYRQAILRAAEDVEDSLAMLTQTKLHVEELEGQVQSLIKARDLSEQAYRSGSFPITDVLDADRQLLTAQDELDANRADVARAAVGVFRAMGGGWATSQSALTESKAPPSMNKAS